MRRAVTGIFFLNGAVFSGWYARLPAIKDDLGLDPGTLGLALLGAPVALLIAQPVVGAIAARRGSRPFLVASPLYMLAVVLPALAFSGLSLFVAVRLRRRSERRPRHLDERPGGGGGACARCLAVRDRRPRPRMPPWGLVRLP